MRKFWLANPLGVFVLGVLASLTATIIGAWIVVKPDEWTTLASLLSAPVPAFLVLLESLILVIFFSALSAIRNRQQATATKAEVAAAVGTQTDAVSALKAQNTDLNKKLADYQERLDGLSSLRIRVIAILARKESSARDLLDEMRVDPGDARNVQAVLDVLGALVTEGVVGRGSLSSDYRFLPQQPQKSVGKEPEPVRYRDVVRLVHDATKHALHSHNIPLCHPGTSQQQQVTAFGGNDANDLWVVKAENGMSEFARRSEVVTSGSIVRLEHRSTRKNLHSHADFPSPVTRQQEVTAFGQDGVGDANDNWRVDVADGGVWREGVPIRLVHLGTNVALHSHTGHRHDKFTSGQQEVTGFQERDDNDYWVATVRRDFAS